MSTNTANSRTLLLQLLLIIGVCAFLFFFGLGAFGLVGADEPRYAQIAREMFNRHDWIVPTLNGSPWMEKPVLLYWKVMGSYRILGVSDWAARVPSAFHATGLVLAVFFFMRRFRRGSELDAALITASCFAVIGFARGASTDMLLSAPFGVALLAWWAWHQTGRKLWLAGFYALLAVGALAKGPVAAALAVLIVGAYSICRRDGKIFLRSLWLPVFLLLWMVIPVIFFSISRSKLPGYILPAIPAAALLTANYLYSRPDAISRLRLILHSLLCGGLVGASLYAPWRMLKQSPPSQVVVGAAIATIAAALAVFLIVRQGGLRVLRSATLLPMVFCLGLLLRPGSHVIDDVNSARAVNARLTQLGAPSLPVAVFNVKREVEYGLNFYRNAPVSRYERDGMPKESHLVVAREGSADALRSLAGQRPIWLGSFPPQHLEFFVVSSAR